MDKLEKIFELQKKFDDELAEKRGLTCITVDKWLQMQTLAMLSELAEFLNELNFKWWKNPAAADEEKIKGELVDILHFFAAMCIKAGMDADELFERYVKKNVENFDRQRGLSEKKGYEL